MAPLLQPHAGPGRAGPGQASLLALTDLVVVVALMFAGALVLLLTLAAADAAWGLAGMAQVDAGAAAWVETVLSLGAMALPLAWIARRWRTLHITPSMPCATSVACGVVAGVLAAGISYPAGWVAEWTGHQVVPSNAAHVQQLLEGGWLLSVFALVVVAPVTEEIMFRKLLLARFLKSGLPVLGIALTSLLFGLMHEPFPGGEQSVAGWTLLLIDYSIAGALFAVAYWITGRLSAAIVAHGTNNLIVCMVYWSSP